MELLAQEITPAKILTRASLENALKVDLAIGGSLDTVLHLPALAHELDGFLSRSRSDDEDLKETVH